MQVLPRTRRSKIVVAILLTALLSAVWIRRDDLWFVAKLAVPGPAYSAAADRTSETAPIADGDLGSDIEVIDVVDAPMPTGDDPSVTLGPLVALEGPSAVVDPAGPGPILVSTLGGQIHEVDLETGATSVVFDVGAQVSTGGERGLLGMALDPEGDRLYLDYTDRGGDTQVRSWSFVDGRPVGAADEGVLHLEIGQPFENHNGGHLVFGPDGALWIATGDGGGAGDRGEVAQDDTWLLGKMLRVVPDPNGGVLAPPSNPAWERPEIWGVGLRNPWRWSFDRATNRMWIADVGQTTIEEVSVVDPDEPQPNFGWDDLEGNNRYEGEPSDDFVDPVVTYTHDDGCSIAGGYVYRGTDDPGLHGWYLFSDFCTGFIRAVPADDPTTDPVELLPTAGSVIAFGELEDGELVLMTVDGIRTIT